jgi:hypothetical protein
MLWSHAHMFDLWIVMKCCTGTQRKTKESKQEASDGHYWQFSGFRDGAQEENANPQQHGPKQEDAGVTVHDVVPHSSQTAAGHAVARGSLS